MAPESEFASEAGGRTTYLITGNVYRQKLRLDQGETPPMPMRAHPYARRTRA